LSLNSWINTIAKGIKQPIIPLSKIYEADELCMFIGSKVRLCWIVYALEGRSKSIVSFNIGRRTNYTLKSVIRTLENAMEAKIYTDKLKNYQYLIPSFLHNTSRHSTNHIERYNLTMRVHLKRLSRRTICFSKSLLMLFAILRIYFWG
jgi:IS1 family transposase